MFADSFVVVVVVVVDVFVPGDVTTLVADEHGEQYFLSQKNTCAAFGSNCLSPYIYTQAPSTKCDPQVGGVCALKLKQP